MVAFSSSESNHLYTIFNVQKFFKPSGVPEDLEVKRDKIEGAEAPKEEATK